MVGQAREVMALSLASKNISTVSRALVNLLICANGQ
jgi:hypothetical protein